MTSNEADQLPIREYHAHVYYTPETRTDAELVRDGIAARFPARLGRWHDLPIGPHTRGMYQVLFATEQFAWIVPRLMLNRRGLDVLVHPDTGDDLADHTQHALWLGQPLPLRLEALQDH